MTNESRFKQVPFHTVLKDFYMNIEYVFGSFYQKWKSIPKKGLLISKKLVSIAAPEASRDA